MSQYMIWKCLSILKIAPNNTVKKRKPVLPKFSCHSKNSWNSYLNHVGKFFFPYFFFPVIKICLHFSQGGWVMTGLYKPGNILQGLWFNIQCTFLTLLSAAFPVWPKVFGKSFFNKKAVPVPWSLSVMPYRKPHLKSKLPHLYFYRIFVLFDSLK